MDEYISNGLAPRILRWKLNQFNQFNQLVFGQITEPAICIISNSFSTGFSSQLLGEMTSFPQFTTFPAEIQALVMTQCLPNDLICLRLTW
jgi:hypothetical protein